MSAPVSGFVGLVIEPDSETVARSYELATALLPPDADQVLGPGMRPHVTLTQCPLRDAEPARLRKLVADLSSRVAGLAVPLSRVIAFPGGFLFWCVDAAAPARRVLQRLHEDALALADSGLDPVANQAVVEATAKATGDDAGLVVNARQYGYAFVADRYLPHITLGFDARTGAGFVPVEHPHVMRAEQVILARLGRLGRIEDVVQV